MVTRLGSRFGTAIGASLLVNLFLVAVASLLVHERGLPQDITDPVGVKLVELAPPEPPEPEEIKEPPKPKPQAKLDFVPDLVRPELSAPTGMDMGIAINVGQFETSDMEDEFVFEAYELDQPPQPVVRVPPVYPYQARERGIEGVVQVKLLVNANGSVGQVQILDARPKGMFEDAVMKSVPQWRFNPGKIEGKAVTAWVVTAVRFDLN
jgi:protein TonB